MDSNVGTCLNPSYREVLAPPCAPRRKDTSACDSISRLGLQPTSMYPANGDLRFRPAIRSQAASYDYYLPLVQLWDAQMRFQGDAAVYIEHKSAALYPGKTIYISMQTPGALGSDKFYPSLYLFISTKMGTITTPQF